MKVVLIDGNSLLFRAYYATAYSGTTNIMRRKDGFPTNAIYSLANIVQKIISTEKPDYAFVAFDTPKPTFRHLEFKEYKAGRKETPQELIDQMQPAREMLKRFGLYVYEQEGYEADDLVGTVSKLAPANSEVHIYSGDKDLLQLISNNVTVCLTKKGVTDLKYMTPDALKEELGILPSQITDLKGLMGDKSDNIPGVSGIGEKTAIKLLNEFGTVERIVEEEIKGKIGETIKEEKETALMSKRLATINTNVPVPFIFDDLKYEGLREDLGNFMQEYEMYSLLKKIPVKNNQERVDYQIVKSVPTSFYKNNIALSLEILGNNYHTNEVIGLGVSCDEESVFICINDLIEDHKFIEYLQNPSFNKSGYDCKKIVCGLRRYDIDVKGLNFDILLATYLLNSNVKDEPFYIYNFYSKIIPYESDVYSRGSFDISNVAKYSTLKTSLLFKLKDSIVDKLKEKELYDLFLNCEMPLNKILIEMESKGVLLDKNLLKNKADEYHNILNNLEKEIYGYAGTQYNINSPVQTAEILFDKLNLPANKKRSTSAQELEILVPFHPIVKKILDYRTYAKLLSVYAEGLPEYILEDSRVHTIYNQALTTTGRLSSSDPNLQNISNRTEEGRQIRKAFVAKNGYKLVSFDYSQIELRVLASVANVSSLIDAFNNHVDIHTLTASKVFGIPVDQVTKSIRSRAKTVNFGIVYGMSVYGLANEVGVSFKEAQEFIDKYFETYPEIKEYYNKVINECSGKGYVRTLFGRIRYINELKSSNYNERELGKRLAINTPIQGSAADIMKLAMIKVDNAIKENNIDCSILMQVHDEIVCEINEDCLDKAINIIKNSLEDFSLKVKLEVEYSIGDSWFEE